MKRIGLVIAPLLVGLLLCKKPDNEPPEVKITSPRDSNEVSGMVSIKVDATDNDRVERVEFYIDERIVNTDTSHPYEYNWNTIGLPDSSYHKILVKGYDPADNVGSDSITVLVRKANSPPNTPANPVPADGDTGQPTSITFYWKGGDPNEGDTVRYDFYLGTDSIPALLAEDLSDTTYKVDTLRKDTRYYWMIVAEDNHGATTQGPVWSFTTKANHPPNTPSNPSPADGATEVNFPVTLSWRGGDPDPQDVVKYDIYFGTDASPSIVETDHPETEYKPSGVKYATQYYWKIVAKDDKGDTAAGPVWSFTTRAQPEEIEIKYDDGNLTDIDGAWCIIAQQNPGEVEDNRMGWCMRMTPPSYPFTLTKVKFGFASVDENFYLHVWDDDGVGGGPGSDLLHTPYLITAFYPTEPEWWIEDISSENVVITSGDFYVGFCYSYIGLEGDPTVWIVGDSSAPFDNRAWVNLGDGWNLFSSYGYEYRWDLMIRAIGYIGGVASPRREVEITGEAVKVYRPIRARFIMETGREEKK